VEALTLSQEGTEPYVLHMPRQRYRGLFKPVQAGFKIPPRFSITEAQGFLHAVAEASARHRVGRTYTDESELTFADEGGTHLKVVPAGSEDEFWAQVAQLSLAFSEAEGRPPTYADDNFWEAINVLHDAYEGPELGNLDNAFEPFVGDPA
jgi:hypothetical protein